MADVEVRPASIDDAAALAPRLRAADVAELWAASRSTPDEALRRALALSLKSWAGLADGDLVVLFGVGSASLLGGVGMPWLLASNQLERQAVPFLRRCRRYRDEMRAGFDRLENFVDARNTHAVRWLGWLGFDLDPPAPFGALGLPFHRFGMEGLCVT